MIAAVLISWLLVLATKPVAEPLGETVDSPIMGNCGGEV